MAKVFVVGNNAQVENMFINYGYDLVASVADADLVCFTGGSDVSPSFYGEPNVASFVDLSRDVAEAKVFEVARQQGVPMVGICRGGQFLNVMCGGRLWQDVNNHAIGGTHPLFTPDGDLIIERASSTHHQMMWMGDGGELLATGGNRATVFVNGFGTQDRNEEGADVEVVYYGAAKVLCFQPHPEYFLPEHECPEYFFMLIRHRLGVDPK